MSWLLKFLPGIGPAFAALANPWILLALVAGAGSCFMYGVHVSAGRLEAFEAKVRAAGEIADFKAAQRTKDQKQIAKETQDETSKALRILTDAYAGAYRAGVRDTNASRRPLPGLPTPAPSSNRDSQVCFDRNDFAERLAEVVRRQRDRTSEGSLPILRRGDQALVALAGCVAQDTKIRALPQQ